MGFAAILPFIIIGIIIGAVRRSAIKQQEARRRAAVEEQQAQRTQTVTRPEPQPTVRPSVQVPTRSEGPKANERVKPIEPRFPSNAHPEHDDCALRPETPPKTVAGQKHPSHDDCALRPDEHAASAPVQKNSGNAPLELTSDQILRGVLFSEIFGKPKALR